jgi:hypothetical protein
MDDLIIAIHEAGHAVARRRLFGAWDSEWGLAIVPDEDQEKQGAAGWHAPMNPYEDDDCSPADLDVCRCARYAAVIAAGFSEADAAEGCDGPPETDFRKVTGELESAKTKAIDLMRQAENVKAVKRIADELLLRRRLRGDHVQLLLDLIDGEIAEQECLQHLSLRGWHGGNPTLEDGACE